MVQGRPGRPRSESARRDPRSNPRGPDRGGYEGLSFQTIAARAGTGKQTLYRWWPSKPAIVADVVVEGYLHLPAPRVPDTGSLETDLKQWLPDTTAALDDPRARAIIRAPTTATPEDEIEGVQLYEKMAGPVHRSLIDRLTRAKSAGQLRPKIDEGAIADTLIGTLLFWILARLPLPDHLAGLLDALLTRPVTSGAPA